MSPPPVDAETHFRHALACLRNGRPDDASAVLQRILRAQPRDFEALHLLGLVEAQRGNRPRAIELITEAVALNPDNAMFHCNRGKLLTESGQLQAALESFDAATGLKPDYALAFFNRGLALQQLGRPDAALASLRRALQLKPELAEAHFHCGCILRAARQPEAAALAFAQAVRLKPDDADAHCNLGVVLQDLDRLPEALGAFDRAIALAPGLADAHYNRANALRELGQFDAALAGFEQAIALQPDFVEAISARGVALSERKQTREAIESFAQAIRLKPGFAPAHSNLGLAFNDLNELDAAHENYLKAIALQPDYADAHMNLAGLELGRMNFEAGWREYEWRFRTGKPGARPAQPTSPKWTGQPSGKPLFVWAEQGIGDQILYASMLNELRQFPQPKTVSVDKKLLSTFRRSFPELALIERGAAPAGDGWEQVAIGSLGQFLRTKAQDFSRATFPYLTDDAQRTGAIKARHPHVFGRGAVCGLSWRSSNPKMGADKSLGLGEFAGLLALEGLSFVNLQYGDTQAETAAIEQETGVRIERVDGVDLFDDIDGLVSIIQACDLVVTVSNSTAHLAGAMGKETLLLVPFSAGKLWYWHDIDGASLWYPSIRIFRQREQGNWQQPIQEVLHYVRKKHG